ncbi:MAG TPA: CRTAC1 family protein, partial [Gammaproteobacteria bacterium]
SLNVIDFDSDGRLDLWLSGHGEARRHALYRNTGGGFADVTAEVGLDAAPGANAIAFLDIDNDGYPDAVIMGASPALLRNEGGRRFVSEALDPAWELQAYTRSIAVDVDGDGRLDVVLMGHRRMILRNTTTGAGGALRVLPRGDGGDGGDPVGTVVSAVYDNGMVQAQRYGSALNTRYSQGSAPLHFGIPRGASITHLRVRWPDGSVLERPVAAGETRIELRR